MDWSSNKFTTDTQAPENNTPSLDEIDNEGTVSTCWILNYSSSSPCNSEISAILEITINNATTTAIVHTASREVEKAGGRYNRAVRDCCNMRLPNGKICLNRSLWYCNECSIWFERSTYYCKQNGRDCFALHHEPLVTNRWHVFPCRCFHVCCLNLLLQQWLPRLEACYNYALNDFEAS